MANRIPLVLGSNADIERFSTSDTLVLAMNSADPVLHITQTGTGPAMVVEDSTNPDATPFVVDASGRLVIGHTSALPVALGNAALQLQSPDVIASGLLSASMWSATPTSAPTFEFARSRNNTIGTHTAVQADDRLGLMVFSGSDGTSFQQAAALEVHCNGTVSSGVVPGRLHFLTTPHGSGTPEVGLTIDANAQVYGRIATTSMTQGFICIPSAPGAPTGAPAIPSGRVPLYFDSTANSLYVYDGSWIDMGGGGGGSQALTISVISTNTNAVNFTTYIIEDTLDLTLPASPSVGDWVRVVNRSGLTDSFVLRNGNNIQGLAEDLQLDSPQSRVTLSYVNSTQGWVIVTE